MAVILLHPISIYLGCYFASLKIREVIYLMASRNVKLAQLKSFFKYLMMNVPEYSEQCSKVSSTTFGKSEKYPLECLLIEAVRKLLNATNCGMNERFRHLAIMAHLYDLCYCLD